MILNRSPELKAVIKIVYVVQIQFESAWALAIITRCLMSPKLYAYETSRSEEEDLNIFLCISLVQTPWGGSILDPGATI